MICHVMRMPRLGIQGMCRSQGFNTMGWYASSSVVWFG
jgi:hypothetical protein